MAGNPLRELETYGQSFWLDYIERRLLGSAQFHSLIENDGLKGMTSNPTIFDKAISGSDDYKQQLEQLARDGKPAERICDALASHDIRTAADLLRPMYNQSAGSFGYVSYEVSPALAHDADATIAEARRIFAAIDRPNLMVKVPSTGEGIHAFEQLTAEGRNINVTLMFSPRHYEAVAEAFIRGLAKRADKGLSLDGIASVASVFVSRIDTLVDKTLDKKLAGASDESVAALRGKAGIANSKLIYQRFKEYFYGADFKSLSSKGARVQRPLWASTGTKNPAYSDVMYVDNLIGPDTVNTMPPATINAFRDHGRPRLSIEEDLDDARNVVRRLSSLGSDLNAVGDQLQNEGVELFAQSYRQLLDGIEARRTAALS